MDYVPQWITCHNGLRATMDYVPQWITCHNGLRATMDYVPQWITCHNGLRTTMYYVPRRYGMIHRPYTRVRTKRLIRGVAAFISRMAYITPSGKPPQIRMSTTSRPMPMP
jgi:hypothetical protein